MEQPLLDAAIAIGLGLMIGLEREHHDLSERAETPMGTRTFALLALAGWAAAFLSTSFAWLPPLVVAATAALVVLSAIIHRDSGRGLTTEAAGIVTVLLGIMVPSARGLAVALGVATTILLISKPWFRKLVPSLRRSDLTSTLQLVVALAIILPLLPTEARDPWRVLSPRRIGLFVTLILGVSWVGYVLTRLFGKQRGAGLTGLLGGLVSSTAVTAAMAQEAKRSEAMIVPGQLATFLACAVMSARLLIITAVVSPSIALAAAPSVGAIGVGMLVGAVWAWRRLKGVKPASGAEIDLANPVALLPALKWGLFLAVVLVASAAGRQYLGDQGTIAAAALAGLADVDAIALAMSRGFADGALPAGIATLAIVVAACVNTVVKAGIALVSGGRRYGIPIAIVFGASLAIGLVLAAVRV